ncbi:hypothetical protein LZ575_03080 [Antarcticibacterium sp. 1MA-6-2]|uniref:hypothetical protein n=1 Tax=Antarcticibacterium sp. 1MA-6-2 TaxID=2908210 RepID=UPI001F40F7EE|nr:hypothetical protein [Antarcticibacterium sp. 1MA-6-2]UJH91686.1 hypothetical protein LZ575_03080 [Antarcticibacterium sp. 1MA-6-2]
MRLGLECNSFISGSQTIKNPHNFNNNGNLNTFTILQYTARFRISHYLLPVCRQGQDYGNDLQKNNNKILFRIILNSEESITFIKQFESLLKQTFMAHVFKIIGNVYTTGVTGETATVKSEYEFISQPFSNWDECRRNMNLKHSEFMANINPAAAEILLHGQYVGYYNIGNQTFTNIGRAGGIRTEPNDLYSANRHNLIRALFNSFNW